MSNVVPLSRSFVRVINRFKGRVLSGIGHGFVHCHRLALGPCAAKRSSPSAARTAPTTSSWPARSEGSVGRPRIFPDDPAPAAELDAIHAEVSAGPKAFTPVGIAGGLTSRETDVLRLMVEGTSKRMIADALSISARTVEVHVVHILTKLNVDSRIAAATWAIRQGVVKQPYPAGNCTARTTTAGATPEFMRSEVSQKRSLLRHETRPPTEPCKSWRSIARTTWWWLSMPARSTSATLGCRVRVYYDDTVN